MAESSPIGLAPSVLANPAGTAGAAHPRPAAATAVPKSPDLTPAEEAAFARELVDINLRHTWWLTIVGLVVTTATFVLTSMQAFPLSESVDYMNGVIVTCGVASLWIIRRLRARSASVRACDRFVVAFSALLLGTMNVYFFYMLPAYGQTSIYVIGMVSVALLIRLPPRRFFGLLVLNHAIFLAVLLSQSLDLSILLPATTDNTAMMMMAGLAGWLLYRAHRGNFQKERVIAQRTAELQAQNHELARLHQLELDEKIAARLGEEKARLEVLRYQLNPHFLFNAFTSICAQLPPALTGARQTIERLTDFCQLTLLRPEGDEHPALGQEIALLRAYLDIEQMRWGDLLAVEIDVAPDVVDERVPSLLLLPLVENALKYGRATQRGATRVRLTARRDEDRALRLEVANTGEWVADHLKSEISNFKFPTAPPSLGIGLENLRQRLARYYPGAHEFTTEAREGWVRARLTLRPTPAAQPNPVPPV